MLEHKEYILDRFEYKLPEYRVIFKQVGEVFNMKHYTKTFNSEKDMLDYTDLKLKERKRYLKLLDTLTPKELSTLFDDIVLMGLSPSQLKEYDVVPVINYSLIEEESDLYVGFASKKDMFDFLIERHGLEFSRYALELVSKCDEFKFSC